MIQKNKALLSVFLLSFFFSSSAFSRGGSEDLRVTVETLRQNVENSNQKLADAMNQLLSIQRDFASMRGFIENGKFLQDEQKKGLKDFEQRLSSMEERISFLTNLLSDFRNTASVEKSVPSEVVGSKEFQKILDLITSEDYRQALPLLQAFLQKNPKHSLADEAQYWVAESCYNLNDFKRAIIEFQSLIQKYPQSTKIKTAILKQGLGFMALKMNNEALPFFQKLVQEYPQTPEAIRANEKIVQIQSLAESRPTVLSQPNSSSIPPSYPSPTPAPF